MTTAMAHPRFRNLAEAWDEFEENVIDKQCDANDRARLRAAFYCGARVLLNMLVAASNAPDSTADQQIESLDREMAEFTTRVIAARDIGCDEVKADTFLRNHAGARARVQKATRG